MECHIIATNALRKAFEFGKATVCRLLEPRVKISCLALSQRGKRGSGGRTSQEISIIALLLTSTAVYNQGVTLPLKLRVKNAKVLCFHCSKAHTHVAVWIHTMVLPRHPDNSIF